MGKLDELKRAAGGNVSESASRRYEPIITPSTLPSASPTRMEGVARSKAALEIPTDKIDRDPSQPREEFDPQPLANLADSIKTFGLLQPIRVRWSEEHSRYILIAGERRWRAAKMAGLATLTCIVADKELSPSELLAAQVTENLLREDLKPIERAKAFKTLMGLNEWSGNRLAQELGISQSSVVHALALLDLPEPIQEAVEAGELAPTVAYEVSKLDDPAAQQEVASRVVTEGMSRGEAIEVVKASAKKAPGAKGKGRGGAAKKVTSKTLKTPSGPKVTVEFKRGLDSSLIAMALREALSQVEEEGQPQQEAA